MIAKLRLAGLAAAVFLAIVVIVVALIPAQEAEAVTLRIVNPYPGVRFPLAASSSATADEDFNDDFENYDEDEADASGLDARGETPTECEGVKWKDYVGADAPLGNDPRPCFKPIPKRSGNTIEKRAANFYRKNLVTTTYAKLALIYATNIVNKVPWFFVTFTGEEAVINYSELGNTGELYEIVDQQFNRPIIQDRNRLVAFVDISYYVWFRQSTWNTTGIWYMYFNDQHEIEQLEIYVDTLGTSLNIGTRNLQFNYTEMCINYFEWCTGENQFFTDFEECYNYYSSLSPDPTGETPLNGKDITCNYAHLVFTKKMPSPHCRHASHLKEDPELDPCQDW